MLFDNHNRLINYARIAVTDRCNLRCSYCMPNEGIDFLPKNALMTAAEIVRVMQILAHLGINKVRITGGEPFVRHDLIEILRGGINTAKIQQIAITTNGTHIIPHIETLKMLGIRSVNLSLDSLSPTRFLEMTRRDAFDTVFKALHLLIDNDFDVKINTVVMPQKNEEDILKMVQLTENLPITVRFIEEMPFNGVGKNADFMDYKAILKYIKGRFPTIKPLILAENSTSMDYQVAGFRGKIGIIAAYSRTFCGTCNRIRITPQGVLKTCLYDNGVFNIRDLMRAGATDMQIADSLKAALAHRAKDGFEAEKKRFSVISESMTTIGG